MNQEENQNNLNENQEIPKMTMRWYKLIRIIKKMGFGEGKLIFQNGEPIRLDVPLKQVKFSENNNDFKEVLEAIHFLDRRKEIDRRDRRDRRGRRNKKNRRSII